MTRKTSLADLLEKQKSAIFPGLISEGFQTFHRTARRSYSPIGEKDRESTMRFTCVEQMAHPPSGLATEPGHGYRLTGSGRWRPSSRRRNWRCCRPAAVKPDRWSGAPSRNTVTELAGSRMGGKSSSRAGNQATTGAATFRASRAVHLVPSRLREQPGPHKESSSHRIADS